MSIRLILDTSAVVAYAAGLDSRALFVAELIDNVEENGDVCGLPIECLLAAYKELDDEGRGRLLELAGDNQGPVVVLPLLAADAGQIAELVLGYPNDIAQAAAESRKLAAMLATFRPSAYKSVVDEEEVLDLGA